MGRRYREPPKPQATIDAEARQKKENDKLDKQIEAREDARKRKKRGRASLISTDERGITDTLGG